MNKSFCHNLIATNRLKELFSVLLTHINSTDDEYNKSTMLILSNQYYRLKEKQILGILNTNEEEVLGNQLLKRTLDLIDKVFEHDEVNQRPTIQTSKPIKNGSLIFDSSKIMLYPFKVITGAIGQVTKKHNTYSNFENNNITWGLNAHYNEKVGLNIFIPIKKGKIFFEYLPIRFNDTKDNLMFFVIPMKSNELVIEVGSNEQADPLNEFSPFRIRKIAMPSNGKWIKDELHFNFNNLNSANEIVFAPRLNEGCPRKVLEL